MNVNSVSMDPIGAWAQLTAIVDEIRNLLAELAASPTKLESGDPSLSADRVFPRVATLATQLRSVFAQEESQGYVADLYDTAPHCSDALGQLKLERARLLNALDEICELAGLQLTPGSFDDIRKRFEQFVVDLAHHEQSEDLLIQRAAFDQSQPTDFFAPSAK